MTWEGSQACFGRRCAITGLDQAGTRAVRPQSHESPLVSFSGHTKYVVLLHSKRNHKQNEKTPIHWEKTFANDETDKGLISKIHKRLIHLNIKTNKQTTQSKNGQKV